jgi:hypothetical protein
MSVVDKSAFRPTPVFRESRNRRLTRVTLVDAADQVQDIMVRDLSARGLSATAARVPPGKGEIVSLRLPDDRVLWGIVRWVDGAQFGIEFDVSSGNTECRTASFQAVRDLSVRGG